MEFQSKDFPMPRLFRSVADVVAANIVANVVADVDVDVELPPPSRLFRSVADVVEPLVEPLNIRDEDEVWF
jgi:hypothetical protein